MPQATPQAHPRLVLGSTSRYRQELLQRLQWPFDVASPQVQEDRLAGESPMAMAMRLALLKAHDVAARNPDAIVIGSDQTAELNGHAIGKPGHHDAAVQQLRTMQGQSVRFHTAVAVVRPGTGFEQVQVASVNVRFRNLTNAQIERYLLLEQPYDCAGSAKCEALGIALLEAIESDDPTALIGLPLIHTCALLREAGLDVLGDRS